MQQSTAKIASKRPAKSGGQSYLENGREGERLKSAVLKD